MGIIGYIQRAALGMVCLKKLACFHLFAFLIQSVSLVWMHTFSAANIHVKQLCREGYFLLPFNELAIAQGPKIQQKNKF